MIHRFDGDSFCPGQFPHEPCRVVGCKVTGKQVFFLFVCSLVFLPVPAFQRFSYKLLRQEKQVPVMRGREGRVSVLHLCLLGRGEKLPGRGRAMPR